MAGFVECLESEEAEEGAEKLDGEGNILRILYLYSFRTAALSASLDLSDVKLKDCLFE